MTTASKASKAGKVDMKLEVAVIPVSDVDRAKHFYENLGWRLDADFVRPDGSRAVQFTPPGSPTSIHLGTGPTLPHFLVVNDIEAARAELISIGVDVSEVFHRGPKVASPKLEVVWPALQRMTPAGRLCPSHDADGMGERRAVAGRRSDSP
jgi:catechol 2,3-dioxygenase-like lactoylglutathione lyase family enzyme